MKRGSNMVTIKIILGSTRPRRFGIQPANWLMEQAKHIKNARFELIDLAEVNLPLLDEPVPAGQRKYSKAHTKNWSQIIDEADGFVFITPEYNFSTSAALKNAIDFVWQEWNYKPLAFVSYGGAAGGARAVEHLRGIAGQLHMFDLREQIVLSNYFQNLDDKGQYQFSDDQAKAAKNMLEKLTFWAEKMQPARAELQS